MDDPRLDQFLCDESSPESVRFRDGRRYFGNCESERIAKYLMRNENVAKPQNRDREQDALSNDGQTFESDVANADGVLDVKDLNRIACTSSRAWEKEPTQISRNCNLGRINRHVSRSETNVYVDGRRSPGGDCEWIFNRDAGNRGYTGVRHLRPVLQGILYRGGASSQGKKLNKRDLCNLCKQGYTLAFAANRGRHNDILSGAHCDTDGDGVKDCRIRYKKINQPYRNAKSYERHLAPEIKDRILGKKKGKIFVHCTAGMHRAGALATLAMQQYCGLDRKQAQYYWASRQVGWSSFRHYKPAFDKFARDGNVGKMTGEEPSQAYKDKLRSMICPKRLNNTGRYTYQDIWTRDNVPPTDAVCSGREPSSHVGPTVTSGIE